MIVRGTKEREKTWRDPSTRRSFHSGTVSARRNIPLQRKSSLHCNEQGCHILAAPLLILLPDIPRVAPHLSARHTARGAAASAASPSRQPASARAPPPPPPTAPPRGCSG